MRVVAADSWTSPQLEAADGVAAWAAEMLAEIGRGTDVLSVATLDGGARESVHFWCESLASGLAFANPRPFPWTLANSPTGRIARELGVRGPTFTLVGRVEALTGAFEHALEELTSSGVEKALLVAFDGISEVQTRLVAASLSSTGGGVADVAAAQHPGDALPIAHPTASETLGEALARVQQGAHVAVGSERDGWITLAPLRSRLPGP